MSIAVLNQVYDETRRLVIAGSNLAIGDFRLKKLVDPLRKSGKKAPVFDKVADAVEKLTDGKEKDSPQALLDLSSLVLAILYTQGATGVKGTAKAIESLDLGISTTQVSSRVLKPLLEALTTKGSGRWETVREAHQRGAFNDLRLINPAINALDDNYPELADYMADEVLPKFGPAIIPEIKDRIDIKGRAGNVRRLRLLYHLDPKTARPIVEDAFENGSKEMKIAALGCLGDSKEDLPHLLEQAAAKSKEVRRVAIERMAPFKGAEVEAIFGKAIEGKDADLVVSPLKKTKNTKLVSLAIEKTKACLKELLETKDKKKSAKLVDQLDLLLCCFESRVDKPTLALLGDVFKTWEDIDAKSGGPTVVSTLGAVILTTKDKKLVKALGAIHDQLKPGDEVTGAALYAAVSSMPPKKVYDELHEHYVTAATSKRESKKTERGALVRSMLCHDWYYYGYNYHRHLNRYHFREATDGEQKRVVKWDPRWLKLAIEHKDTDVVCDLAGPKDKAAMDYLVGFVRDRSAKTEYWEMYDALRTLVECKHKDATDLVLELIDSSTEKAKKNRGWYGGYYLFDLISKLPKSAAKKVEALLPKLPDNYVDHIVPYLLTLKQKK